MTLLSLALRINRSVVWLACAMLGAADVVRWFFLSGWLWLPFSALGAASKPNLVFIMADD
jgi:hypothetical protein